MLSAIWNMFINTDAKIIDTNANSLLIEDIIELPTIMPTETPDQSSKFEQQPQNVILRNDDNNYAESIASSLLSLSFILDNEGDSDDEELESVEDIESIYELESENEKNDEELDSDDEESVADSIPHNETDNETEESDDESLNESLDESENESLDESIDVSVADSEEESVADSEEESIDVSDDESIDESDIESVTEEKKTNYTINELLDMNTGELKTLLKKYSTNIPVKCGSTAVDLAIAVFKLLHPKVPTIKNDRLVYEWSCILIFQFEIETEQTMAEFLRNNNICFPTNDRKTSDYRTYSRYLFKNNEAEQISAELRCKWIRAKILAVSHKNA